MLKETIRSQFRDAMKARDAVAKEVLRVAIGEIDVAETRANAALDDASIEKILRKLVKSNNETLKMLKPGDEADALRREVEILEALLPKMLSQEQVAAALATVKEPILAANNDGQAIGVAMKHLKGLGSPVDGKTVRAAVQSMRQA